MQIMVQPPHPADQPPGPAAGCQPSRLPLLQHKANDADAQRGANLSQKYIFSTEALLSIAAESHTMEKEMGHLKAQCEMCWAVR